ncbi:MAG: GAF domain-containing protein [Pseudomonadota bacterium]|nr:GAF domain-containing protein [Pseudomonadota bacterium]
MLQDWRVSDGTSEIVVEADGWLGALAVALGAFGLEFGALGRLSCSMQENGGVLARGSTNGAEFLVEPVTPGLSTPAMPDSGFPTPADPEEAADPAPAAPPEAPEAPARSPAPAPPATPVAPAILAAPVVSAPAPLVELVDDEPTAAGAKVEAAHRGALTDDMVEDLFLRLGELSSCTGLAEASAVALRIVLDLVPAGASAVLIRTRAGDGLRFRAASGPAANQLIDTVIPLERGIAGHVVQLGLGITIEDVLGDRRHDRRLDRSTGFTTRAMLAVPVRADTGAVYGCIELLNPPRPFSDGDFEVAARVAASLGTFLNSVYAER